MRRLFTLTLLLGVMSAISASPADCPHDLAESREVRFPSRTDVASRMVWFYASNHSPLEWLVFPVKGRICARTSDSDQYIARPAFVPEADSFRGASRLARVDDGWLVGFNQGEFGAALYWFSLDGLSHYKISEHQVVEFFRYAGEWAAIEGLDHLGLARGSIIRITRTNPQRRWQVQTALTLTSAPYAVAQVPYGPTLVVLSHAVVAIEGLNRPTALLENAPWEGLYPQSAALTADSRTLYIGMRQYVAELDLRTRKLRMLLPRGAALNQLPENDEKRLRATYRR